MAGEIFNPISALDQLKSQAVNFGGQIAGTVTSLPGTIIGGANTLLQPVYNAGSSTSTFLNNLNTPYSQQNLNSKLITSENILSPTSKFNFPSSSTNNLQSFSTSSLQLSQQPSQSITSVNGGLTLPISLVNTPQQSPQVSLNQKINEDFNKLTLAAGSVGSTIGSGLNPIMKTFTPSIGGVTNTLTQQPQSQLQPHMGNIPIFNQALQGVTNAYGDIKKNLEFNPTGTTSLSQGYSSGTGKITSQSTSKLEENLGIGKTPEKITINERSSVIDNLNNLYKSSEEFKKDNPLFIVNPVLGSIAAMATPDKSDPNKMKWDIWNENVAKETTQKIIPSDEWVKSNTGGPTANFTRGLVGYVRDRPLDVGVDIGTMIGMELLSGGTATAATPEIVATGGVRPLAIKGLKSFGSKIIPYVEPGMMTLYGGSAAVDIANKPTQEAKEMALGGWSGRFITGFGDNAVRSGLTRNVVDSVPNDMRIIYNNIDEYAKSRGIDLLAIPEAGIEHNFLINLDDNKVISMIEGDAGSVPGQKIYDAVKEAYDNGYKNIVSLHTHPGGSPTPSGSMIMDSQNIGQVKGLSGDLMSEVKQFNPDGIIKKYGIISTNPEGFGYNRRFVTYDVAPTQLDAQGRAITNDNNRDNLEMYLQKKQMVQDYNLLPQESKYFSSSDPLYKAKEFIYPYIQKLDSLPLQKVKYALHDFTEPLLYKDAEQLRMFDKIPGVNAVRVDPKTPLDTEYTGIRDLKNIFSGNKVSKLPRVESISGGLNQLDKKMEPIIQLNPLEKQTLTKLRNGELTSENIIGFDKNGNIIPIEFESGPTSVKVITKDKNIVGDSHPHLSGMPPSLDDLQRAQILSIDPVTWEPTGYKTRILASDKIYEISGKITGQDIKLVQAKTELATDRALREAERLNPGGVEEIVSVDDVPIGVYRIPNNVNLREIQKTAKIDALTSTLGDRIKIVQTNNILKSPMNVIEHPDTSVQTFFPYKKVEPIPLTELSQQTKLAFINKPISSADIVGTKSQKLTSVMQPIQRGQNREMGMIFDENNDPFVGIYGQTGSMPTEPLDEIIQSIRDLGRDPSKFTYVHSHPYSSYDINANRINRNPSPEDIGIASWKSPIMGVASDDRIVLVDFSNIKKNYHDNEGWKTQIRAPSSVANDYGNIVGEVTDSTPYPEYMDRVKKGAKLLKDYGIKTSTMTYPNILFKARKPKKFPPKLKLKLKPKKQTPLLTRINIKPLNLNPVKKSKVKIKDIPKKKSEIQFKMPEITLNHKADKMVDFKIPEINLNLNIDKFKLPILKKKIKK